MKTLRASLLTVGTEITSGEILNSNSQWLSVKLEDLGFEVVQHISVPDDRELIAESLLYTRKFSDVLLVTGGLGPTTDDFTREVIAQVYGLPLEFSDEVWGELNRRYQERSLRVRKAHRQQCEFPQTATILRNIVGTAHGFSVESQKQKIIVLPGPPREIEGMWDASVVPELQKLNSVKTHDLYRWVCTGATESEVAEVVEEIISGAGFKVGYRANKPFIHVKLWVDRSRSDANTYLDNLNLRLAKWIVKDS